MMCMDYDAIFDFAYRHAKSSRAEVDALHLSHREMWRLALGAAIAAEAEREESPLLDAVLEFGTLTFANPCSGTEPADAPCNVHPLREAR